MGSGRTFVAQARASSAPEERVVPLSGFVALASLPVCCRWNTSERACPPRTSKRRAIDRRAPCGKDPRSGGGRGRGRGRVFLIHRRISLWHGMCGRHRDPFALRDESSVHRTYVASRASASRRDPSRIAVARAMSGKRPRQRCGARWKAVMRAYPPHSGRALQIRNISRLSARAARAMRHDGQIIFPRPDPDNRRHAFHCPDKIRMSKRFNALRTMDAVRAVVDARSTPPRFACRDRTAHANGRPFICIAPLRRSGVRSSCETFRNEPRVPRESDPDAGAAGLNIAVWKAGSPFWCAGVQRRESCDGKTWRSTQ